MTSDIPCFRIRRSMLVWGAPNAMRNPVTPATGHAKELGISLGGLHGSKSHLRKLTRVIGPLRQLQSAHFQRKPHCTQSLAFVF